MDFANKRVVVTGAASGIGLAMVEELVRKGARVLMADVNDDAMASIARRLGPHVSWIHCNVADHGQVEALGAHAAETLGGCDVVFVNAGVIANRPVIKTPVAEVDWVMGVNVRGAWSTAAVFAAMMMDQDDGGRVCFTCSEHSLGLQHGGCGIYTATKHAVLALADVMRLELPDKIVISAFCPGLVDTALGSGERPEGLSQSSQKAQAIRMVHAHGMSAHEAAARAIGGVARGDFYIMTHPHAFQAAERRYQEIRDAFSEQAPWEEGAERYDVNRVIAKVTGALNPQAK